MPHPKGELNRICKYCGKWFHTRKSLVLRGGGKYCSRECCFNDIVQTGARKGQKHPRWKGIKIKKICKYCGREFIKQPGQIKQRRCIFCSKTCYSKSLIRRVERICKKCGKSFFVNKYRADEGGGKYCCKDCSNSDMKNVRLQEKAGNWRGGKIKRICAFCNKEFECFPYSVRKGFGKFCSKECHFEYVKKFGKIYGENHPSWKGGWFPYYGPSWRRISKQTIKKANYESEISHKSGIKLDVHHIIPIRRFIEKYIELCLTPYIPEIKFKSLKVIPIEIIPAQIFYEANNPENLIVVTKFEHKNCEGKTIEFFNEIKKNNNKFSPISPP